MTGGTIAPTRPVLRWHGGKWRLAPWIIAHLPPHRIYCEPYGGGASVLLRKRRAHAEIYNDLDGDVVHLFRVLRDPAHARALVELLTLTPYAREEWRAAHKPTDDAIERARRYVVKSMMGFGSAGAGRSDSNGFRLSLRKNTSPAVDWIGYGSALARVAGRLQGVVIEHRPALSLLPHVDSPRTLFYCDPPYLAETRTATRGGKRKLYAHEMTDDEHRTLAAALHALEGMVAISAYPCALYDRELYAGWQRHETTARADGGKLRAEVLYLNPAAASALEGSRRQQSLFAT